MPVLAIWDVVAFFWCFHVIHREPGTSMWYEHYWKGGRWTTCGYNTPKVSCSLYFTLFLHWISLVIAIAKEVIQGFAQDMITVQRFALVQGLGCLLNLFYQRSNAYTSWADSAVRPLWAALYLGKLWVMHWWSGHIQYSFPLPCADLVYNACNSKRGMVAM